MQEYTIDKDTRRNVTVILIIFAIIIATLMRTSGAGNAFIQLIRKILGIKNNETFELLDIIPNIVSAPFWYGILWYLFDRYLWKCKIFQMYHHVPNIEGLWDGELMSCYDQSTKHKMQLEVKQTWSHIHFTANFEKSSSESNIAAILSNDTGDPIIYFGFQNHSRDRSAHQQIYDGYNRIELKNNTMYGSYSNNRQSNKATKSDGNCGSFTLTKRD